MTFWSVHKHFISAFSGPPPGIYDVNLFVVCIPARWHINRRSDSFLYSRSASSVCIVYMIYKPPSSTSVEHMIWYDMTDSHSGYSPSKDTSFKSWTVLHDDLLLSVSSPNYCPANRCAAFSNHVTSLFVDWGVRRGRWIMVRLVHFKGKWPFGCERTLKFSLRSLQLKSGQTYWDTSNNE